jgi:hypothetical protein
MAMTKITYYVSDYIVTPEQKAQIDAKINELIANGSTDGYNEFIPPGAKIRHWVDQDAAVAWKTWITNFAANNGYSFSVFEIADL